MIEDAPAVLKAMLDHLHAVRAEARRGGNRFYPGLERVTTSQGVRSQLLLAQIQSAINHQSYRERPWQRYEPLWAFLDPDIWPTDQAVLQDLSFARLAIQMLSEAQRQELETALAE